MLVCNINPYRKPDLSRNTLGRLFLEQGLGVWSFDVHKEHKISADGCLIALLSKVAEQYAREPGAPLDLWMGSIGSFTYFCI